LSLAAREVSRQFAADNPSMADNVRLFLIIMESNVSHCLWEQVMTLSKLADPSIADDVKVLLDYCGVDLSHCLWEQVMNLSKLLITPSIADNVKALF
jgi:hypothetical protein